MIHGLDTLRQGFSIDADVVVVGSGAGGAVAAANFAEAGLRTVVIEAGPEVRNADMTRDAPRFLAKYYWDGGLRLISGSTTIPSMQGRCLGGSTVMNSAIMLKLPDWVRRIWAEEDGLHGIINDSALDRGFQRAYERCRVAPTPMTVLGKRSLLVKQALEEAGIPGYPLPRAVHNCQGCADCITGCAHGAKQSMDRSHLPVAQAHGAQIYTCSAVEQVITQGTRAVAVRGSVVDPQTYRKVAKFEVRAPRVVLAAGAMATPVILQKSRINPHGRVGKTLYMHLTTGCSGVFEERVDPWVGATQGWGAFSPDIQGLKYESLWAPPSLIAVNWGGLGEPFLREIQDLKHATIVALVYRGKVSGSVTAKRDGSPRMRLYIPKREVHVLMRGLKPVADAMLRMGARFISPSMTGRVPKQMRTPTETQALLSPAIGAKDTLMTGNHVFGSCRMSSDPRRGPVDPNGRVHGVAGLWVVDSSIFPSPSAVNPQATVMALADVISRRVAGLAA